MSIYIHILSLNAEKNNCLGGCGRYLATYSLGYVMLQQNSTWITTNTYAFPATYSSDDI